MDTWDAMVDMYLEIDIISTDIPVITLKGIEGPGKRPGNLRRCLSPVKIGAYEVLKARDYQADTIKDLATGEVTERTSEPNVLYITT